MPIDPITRALHLRVETDGAKPSVTALFQSSAFEAGSPYFYSRKDNPNVAELEEVVAVLEGARHAVAFGSGMAAISAALDFLRPGNTLVINRLLYGCSFKHFQRVSERLGLKLVIADLSDHAALAGVEGPIHMVFFETPTNPFLRTLDIAEVAGAVKARHPDALIVVDNTWATPLFQQPLEWGADLSVHSGTKYIGGHSDLMCGLVLTDRDDLSDSLRACRFYGGAVLDPHSAWLARRSLQTLGVRVKQQASTTRQMCRFLEGIPQIARVFYPTIDGRQLRDYGGIVFVELAAGLETEYPCLLERLHLYDTGTGMACVTSMIAQPYSGSHASMTDLEKERIGLSRSILRLCFGLEEVEDLKQDLSAAFTAIGK